jgi:hypothetical protein
VAGVDDVLAEAVDDTFLQLRRDIDPAVQEWPENGLGPISEAL